MYLFITKRGICRSKTQWYRSPYRDAYPLHFFFASTAVINLWPKFISAFLLAGILLLTSTTFHKTAKAENYPAVSTPDFSNHLVYSNYKFNNTEDVVNLGVQPIYSPTGFISEAMKRDAVLNKELSRSGMKLRFYAFLKGDDVNCFLKQGDIDVGIGGDMPAITAAATLDIIIPTLIQQGFTSVIANRPMLIRELRGKKIGYAFGSNAHYALLKTLSSDGLNEAQVNLIPMEVTKMPEALQAGKIEAFSAWEPTSTITLIKYPNNVVIHRYLSSGYIYFVKTFSDRWPEVVRQIIAAEIRALRWMQSNRQNLLQASEWALQAGEDLTNHKLELSVEQYASLAESDILGLTSAPIIPQNDLRQNGPLHMEFEFLKNMGKIPASTNWDKVHDSFDLQVIIEVLANAKKYKLNEFDYE
ncbi:MAG: NrtA/SsuA/CpmA family ABC transporter substrate-binding protein [Candidatus Scalindua sp.]